MNKKLLSNVVAVVLNTVCVFVSGITNAALTTDANLSINQGSSGLGLPDGSSTGSWFSLLTSGPTIEPETWVTTGISGLNGINLGAVQDGSGASGIAPNGAFPVAEAVENIDNSWVFSGNTGVHKTTLPITIISDDDAGNVTLDFSGWGVSWGGIENISLWTEAPNGIAIMTCAIDCSNGDTYILDYAVTAFASSDRQLFFSSSYRLHLEGAISTVPVPTAIWLFGSGLVGLAGVARCRKPI